MPSTVDLQQTIFVTLLREKTNCSVAQTSQKPGLREDRTPKNAGWARSIKRVAFLPCGKIKQIVFAQKALPHSSLLRYCKMQAQAAPANASAGGLVVETLDTWPKTTCQRKTFPA